MFKIEKINKFVAVFLTASLLFFYTLSPMLTYAQVATPTPDPSTVTPTPTDTPTPTPDLSTVTPTPDPSAVTPTPAPDPAINASDSADLANTVDSTSVTGDNSLIATDSGTMDTSSNSTSPNSGGSGSSIQTGNAASVVDVQNSVNSTTVNSTVINQTLNIFVTQTGNLNLSDPFTVATNAIQTHPNDPVVNISFTNINNYAYLTNTINSSADTGNNAADQSASIQTGNAYSVVSLLNQVNFTVDNSQIHIVTINIFGELNGNIILPDPVNTSSSCSGCGVDINTNNTAAVTNNLNATSDTGNNIASGSATITTGDAQSSINSLNIVNTSVSGTNAEVLYINDLGTWNGNFIGWGNFDPAAGGASLVLYNFTPNQSGSSSGQTNINNAAFVQNDVSSLASSGRNVVTGNSSSISTGNAFSVISLLNFINTNFINSFGFFGFINIFGNWNGNIGGASKFAALNANNNSDALSPAPVSSDTNSTQEQGGQLAIENSNNVGAFVYPGDTVTFSIKVKNTGTGKVYGAKLNLSLIFNGQSVSTTSFNLGDIDAQKGVKVTTGIVLPKNSPGGLYVARAVATGNVGLDNSGVSAAADSNFNVMNNTTFAYGSSQISHVAVLSAHQNGIGRAIAPKGAQNSLYLLALIIILLTYVLVRGIKKREYLATFLLSKDFKEKVYSLRIFLF